jgi:hypothetical protein
MRSGRSLRLVVVICLVAGLTLACGDDDDAANESIAPTPTTTATARSAPATSAPPTAEPTVPATTAPAVAPTAMASTTAAGVVRVPPELASSPDGEVLYEAGVGSAPDQLGLEDCAECDPMRPLSPMLTSDGRLVIPDVENRRWVIVDEGQSSTFAMPADLIAWDVLMGPGDVVYVAAFTLTPGGPANPEVVAFDAADLSTILARSSIQSRTLGMLAFNGEEVVLALGPDEVEERFPLARPAPETVATVELPSEAGSPSLQVTTSDGMTTTWVLEQANLEDAMPLADGTVAVSGGVEREDTSARAVWVLRPDGTYTGQQVATMPDPANGLSLSERGIVSLERDGDTWRVVRFPLPS